MSNRSLTLPDLLADHGIAHKGGLSAGRRLRLICPRCNGGKSKEQCLSLTIDQDGLGATWICHRGQCGWKEGARLEQAKGVARSPPREAAPIMKPEPSKAQPKPKALYAFFEARGIGAETVDTFGVYVQPDHFFPGIGQRPAIVFPYLFKGELANRKYRPPEKHPQAQDKGALPTLFNADSVGTPDVVIWCEGEPDVMALHEAGYRQVVSLKDGAPAELRAEDDPRREDDKRFAALATHADLLAEVGKFILAGDADEPGAVLREELARRLGRHRCWTVTWPEGCKDAGDVLKLHGPDAVRTAVDAAEPYPIEGVQRIKLGMLSKLRAQKPPPTLTTGTAALNRVLSLPGEGRLIIVTGTPNSGKTALVSYFLIHTAREHERRWAVFSPEMQPWEQYAAMLAQTLVGKPFWPHRGEHGMDDPDILFAEDWLERRCTFLVSDAEDKPPTLDWILERARACVLRDGTTDLLVDPWNEVEHRRDGMTETEYVGRGLQRLKAFGLRHGCNMWVIAHPTKLVPPRPGAPIPVPGLYDIAGGANWANKADLGLVVHTGSDGSTEVHVAKARFRRFGRKGAMAKLDFDAATGRYRSPVGSQPTLEDAADAQEQF